MGPKIDPEGLLAPGLAQDRPQDASKGAFGRLRGRKNFGRAQKRPKEIPPSFFCTPQKNLPPPHSAGGGLPFLENRCWRLGGVQKSRVQGLRGHSPGLGGEVKASPTTSFACCLKLRFAKLEAPLHGAGPGLTTARQVGRRICFDFQDRYRSLGEGCPNGKFSEERCVCVRARGLCDGEVADARWANPGLGVYCSCCCCCSCPDLGLGFVSVLSRCCLAPPPPNSLSPNGWRYR